MKVMPTKKVFSIPVLFVILLGFISFCEFASARSHHKRDQSQSSQPGVFDYYLLNLSWEPEFCQSPRNADSEECLKPTKGFVVHGLWPQFTNGYPEHCSTAAGPANPSAFLDLIPTAWLVQHEWTTHGTCSGLSADDYFALIRTARASIKIPDQFSKPGEQFTIAPAEVKQSFVSANPNLRTEDIAVSCGNNYLTAVEFCMSKDGLKPMACTSGVRDCRANTITVTGLQ
jgi:ribonuclease T2